MEKTYYNAPIVYGAMSKEEDCNTRHCANLAKIKRNLAKYNSLCQASDSIGFLSGHNCANKDGRSYLCVRCGKAVCMVARLFFSTHNCLEGLRKLTQTQ